MAEKRVKFTIDKEGNYKIETLAGFAGTGCTQTVESIAACVGGTCDKQGDKDDMYRNEDPNVMVDDIL